MKKNISISNFLIIALSLVIFGMIGYINHLYPMSSDDWIFATADDGSRISSLADIIQSTESYYFGWGGRVVVHFISRIVVWIGPPISKILNTLVFVLLMVVIYRTSNVGKKSNWVLFWLLFLGMWFFQPQFPETVFWLIGSINYSWACLFIFTLLYFYISYFMRDESSRVNENIILKSAFLFLFGVFAAWTHENTTAALIGLIVLLLIYMKYISMKTPAWMYWGLLGVMTGFALLVLAPGNFIRASASGDEINTLKNIANIGRWTLKNFKYLLPLYIVLILLIRRFGEWDKKRIALSVIFLLASFGSLVVMIPSPYFPERAWFGSIIYLLIANGLLISGLKVKALPYWQPIIIVLCLAASSWFVRDYTRRIPTMKGLQLFWEQRNDFVEQQLKEGVREVTFETTFRVRIKDYGIGDFAPEASFWMNDAYARYYGLDSVRVSKDAELVDMKRYYREYKKKQQE